MVRNDFCLGAEIKQNALFLRYVSKNAPKPSMSRIDPAS